MTLLLLEQLPPTFGRQRVQFLLGGRNDMSTRRLRRWDRCGRRGPSDLP
ncbi:hypothetical protein OG739_18010 [Streptomyces longwoodensis]|nr:hypothetical protein [Streptomyces longwoodensis]MCX4994630.1 hypothetical protein [Streptomyces longwoodensis]